MSTKKSTKRWTNTKSRGCRTTRGCSGETKAETIKRLFPTEEGFVEHQCIGCSTCESNPKVVPRVSATTRLFNTIGGRRGSPRGGRGPAKVVHKEREAKIEQEGDSETLSSKQRLRDQGCVTEETTKFKGEC